MAHAPGCPGGTVDVDGFCDACFVQVRVDVPAPGPVATPAVTPAGGRHRQDSGERCEALLRRTDEVWRVAGLVDLPVLELPEPGLRVIDPDLTVSAVRRCGKDGCAGKVGGSHVGQESLLKGFCPQCGTPFSFSARLHPGELVAGQYEIVGPLAQSGFGWVYLARDKHLDDNHVVLKGLVNTNDADAAQMAVRERQYLTRLHHPNIVRIFNAVTHTDQETGGQDGYIVMEYVDGLSLEEVRRTAMACTRGCGHLPPEHVLAVGHEILAALEYLHGQGLLYCDMKPDNVMRGRGRFTVIDLGGMTEIAARDRSPVGHPHYQAPEIRLRGATVRSDLYAVGRTLDRLLAASDGPGTRSAPDERTAVAVESFRKLIRRATVDEPDRRFATAGEMREQLTGVLRELVSLREGREHPASSTLFAPTAAVIDAGLGGVPPLSRWTEPAADRLWLHRPPAPLPAALGLPMPRVDGTDPAARFLADGSPADARDAIVQAQAEGDSAELRLRAVRAHLELNDADAARECLGRAGELLAGTPGQWRLAWYRGLLHLALDGVDAAHQAFAEVRETWPGETAPELALALCAERTDRPARAEQLFSAVWTRDRSQTSAAFGLTRLRLAAGQRQEAAAVLDEVPLMSPHRDAARVAAVRALADGPAPGEPDVAGAGARLAALRLSDEAARGRLTAVLREAAFDGWSATGVVALRDGNGTALTEDGLRKLLELSYRDLAGQARAAREHVVLVDLANRIRPRTLLSGWR